MSLTELFLEYKRIILLDKSSIILVLLGIRIESKSFSFLSLGRLKLISLLPIVRLIFLAFSTRRSIAASCFNCNVTCSTKCSFFFNSSLSLPYLKGIQ